MIKYIPQSTDLICGQACIAMLANISIEEAINKMGTDGSTEPIDIINGLKACGVKCKDTYNIEVNVLGINNDIATVEAKSQYIDYLHMAKIDGKWMIVNVLWNYNNKE